GVQVSQALGERERKWVQGTGGKGAVGIDEAGEGGTGGSLHRHPGGGGPQVGGQDRGHVGAAEFAGALAAAGGGGTERGLCGVGGRYDLAGGFTVPAGGSQVEARARLPPRAPEQGERADTGGVVRVEWEHGFLPLMGLTEP